jgi:hypothetical protein
VPMHSDSCFIIDGESRMIAGKEVHEGMRIGHLRSLLVSGLVAKRCDSQQNMFGGLHAG